MQQFRIYLRAELGKLRKEQDAADFIAVAEPAGVLDEVVLPSDPGLLSRRLDCQDAVDEFVGNLPPEVLPTLAKSCSEWRNNPDLYEQLSSAEDWYEGEIKVESIFLKPAERDLEQRFSELGYQLAAIATDPVVLSSHPYSQASPGDAVAYPLCLARRHPNGFRLFDGMHRAIQLVRNRQARIPLLFADEDAPWE